MVKFVVIALAIFIAYKLFANDFLRKRKEREEDDKKNEASKAASGELVKDPICGAYVSVENSVSVRDSEKVYRFCSYECRDKFIKQVEKGRDEIEAAPSQEASKTAEAEVSAPEAEASKPEASSEAAPETPKEENTSAKPE